MKPKVFFKTFGCRTNLFDTQVMIENLKDFELTQNEEEAHIVIINSCTVTNGADSGVRQYLNKIQKKGKKIYFTGCGVATKGKEVYPQVSGVFAHDHKENINTLLKNKTKFFLPTQNQTHIDQTLVSEFVGKSRAFIKIQEGCDFTCSYCIIPFSRGKARSLPQERILTQIQTLAQEGIKEVVLTGTNMGSYGKDTQTSVAKLIKQIAKIPNIKRIRLGSLEPSQIDEEFLELLGEEFLERHLHIALQYTHDRMLEIMNRHNRFKTDLELFEKIASKGFALGSDYIVGHPGESEEVWNEAYENLKLFPLTHIHPFIYSPRSGTPSASMTPRINGDQAKKRLHMINQLIAQNNFNFRQKYAEVPLKVLIENQRDETFQGFDQFFNKVKIQSSQKLSGWVEINSYTITQEHNFTQL
ncbi:tRNA (N(6)-L-threonylcarbamoyladenosine(37)-C(2))-methylthiotransferase MtaB [Helicobacter kayseriensis]|uniref:tRNA (N(6)-L-threonylcarbamoyladenosine(37)-C(2))- methylthiotransferase MtaB n=1 Tax=Helicobacter kayseriensis TaxID=2905877 RepID=UPI001E312539|nr:tRNA (N(6)-L-threonylcarbamoyladenosine(37)-C(2))-methylthiotransferase MtaB [Helicobacter kayseriensis]MCE3047451.1 tRNA (N(6)-L-threonylcarbamoyladenosine(37)-C(2))-methylthiotransferase MtaB [Helicobacter kayseriensis]MCE3048816.1 tRNA (N(6)-L-threonylcarbamoyladenosine(37)-C(2))-methylthiotransferase MtaB [Helicobacter kayseriensis]